MIFFKLTFGINLLKNFSVFLPFYGKISSIVSNMVNQKYKIALVYPPGAQFQRGEERCQIDIQASAVNSNRACNDLGYAAALLKHAGYDVFLRDYQAEKLSFNDFIDDIERENIDMLFISITNGSIFDDIKTVNEIKKRKPEINVILKGALFFNPEKELFKLLDLNNIDYLIGGEVEFIIEDLVNAHYKDKELLKTIQGISYKTRGEWVINKLITFNDNLDALPFPDRSLMKNDLYINPETNKPMALITSSKGCCYSCSYCLSHVISGKKVRERSISSIISEIEECINKYNITNFFLKSDTFIVNKSKVLEFCSEIIKRGLNKKINWTVSSRADSIDDEILAAMKKAGCSLIAIGFESGSSESLKLMQKGVSVEQNIRAAKLCRKHGIKILGHFLTGFPWETEKHLEETRKHIFEINADYIEISIAVPYYGTQIYREYADNKNTGCLSDILGADSYNNIYKKYSKLSPEYLQNYRKQILLKYYMRPSYIFNKIMQAQSPAVIGNYIKYGLRLLKNCFISRKSI